MSEKTWENYVLQTNFVKKVQDIKQVLKLCEEKVEK